MERVSTWGRPAAVALLILAGAAGGVRAASPEGSSDLLDEVVRVKGCRVERLGGHVQLTGRGRDRAHILSVREFPTPLVIRTRVRTNSTNVRLHYGLGQLIFNWEAREDELIIHDPVTGDELSAPGEGWIGELEWRDITWVIDVDEMRVLVDGETRYELQGDFRGLSEGVGIGPAWGSVVDVAALAVAPLD